MNEQKFAIVNGQAVPTSGTIKNAFMHDNDEDRERKRRKRRAAKGEQEPEFVSIEAMRENGTDVQSGENLEETVAQQIINSQLHKAMGELAEKRLKIIRLRYFEGLSVRETATILGVSAGTVQHHEKMALKELGEKIPNPYEIG